MMTKEQFLLQECAIVDKWVTGCLSAPEYVEAMEELNKVAIINPKALQIWYDEGRGAFALKHPNAPEIYIPIERCEVAQTAWGKPRADQRGWEILTRLLRDNAQQNKATIGMPAAPVQYMVDGWIKGVVREAI